MQDPWSLYWQSDCLESCVATQSTQDVLVIARFWEKLALQLHADAQVLDVATGNGAVPATLLKANSKLGITAVDKAKIDPLRFLSAPGALIGVNFQADVDICTLPFEGAVFDAVTSQFGIEYASLEQAGPELLRVAKCGARVRFLMHHADSKIVVPARRKRHEMDTLLAAGGILSMLRAYLDGENTSAALESAGEAHLASEDGRSRQITGQIFEGVNRVINSVRKGDQAAANELCNVMIIRLRADRDRLQQLDNAALGEERLEEVVNMLDEAGARAETVTTLCANAGTDDELLIGWQYCGEKA